MYFYFLLCSTLMNVALHVSFKTQASPCLGCLAVPGYQESVEPSYQGAAPANYRASPGNGPLCMSVHELIDIAK